MDRIAYALILLFTAFLIIFGWKFHPIENIHSPENDRYVDTADQIRGGHIPKDPFRPLLYPIVAAGAGAVLGDTFVGARLTTSLFGGLLALFTYLLGRRCFSRRVGLFAALGVMLNQMVIVEGVHAASDIAFSSLVMFVLLLSLGMDKSLGPRSVLMLALFFSLAYFTRYQAILLLPTVLIAFSAAPGVGARRKLSALFLFAVGASIFLLPHFYLTYRAFGNPFYSENWKNLAFKLYGERDWSYYEHVPFDGWLSVIMSAPGAVAISAIREITRFVYSGVISLGGGGPAGALFAAAFLFGIYIFLTPLSRANLVILSFLLVYTVGVAATYETWARYMLPILPLGYILAGSFIFSDAFGGCFRLRKYRIQRAVPVAAVFLAALCCTSVKALPGFIESHPVKEVEAGIMLQKRYGSDLRVLGTFPFVGRHVKYWYDELERVHADERGNKAAYYNRLRKVLAEERVDYVIIGRLTIRDRPGELLTGAGVPPFLSLISRNGDTAVYRVVRPKLGQFR